MDEPMFLVLAIRHSVTEWRCDQSRRVPSVPRALGPPLCFSVAVLNQSSSSMSCLLTRKGVGSKLRIGSLDLKMRGAARPSRSNSHDEPYISSGRSPAPSVPSPATVVIDSWQTTAERAGSTRSRPVCV